MTKSLYAVLNVSPNADPAVIEAAYKALMKKYHPDILVGAPSGDQQKAAEINEAFQVLRDPERRARYDSDQRARQEAIRRAAMAAAPPPQQFAGPRPVRRRRWPSFAAAALVAAALYFWLDDPDRASELLGGSLGSLAAQTTSPAPETGAVRVQDVDVALGEYRKIKQKTGLLGLAAFSQDCFADQSRVPTVRALDVCVAFDHAAANYAARIVGDDLPQLPRFRADELDMRHESAARLVSSDDSWIRSRRATLLDLTLQRLKLSEAPAQPVGAAALVAPVAAAAAAPNAQPTIRRAQYRRPVYRARPQQRVNRAPAKRKDRDFLEREGYIY